MFPALGGLGGYMVPRYVASKETPVKKSRTFCTCRNPDGEHFEKIHMCMKCGKKIK